KIVDEFLAQQVPGELSDHFTRLLSDCEFFRFSQNKNELNSTESVYNDVVDVISKLDSILKKKKK
ncbi:MAG: hypothetical protein PHU66_06595, partial [Bacteroidaceae bacterium]|nr:hypothetical protein [Bacteroidaceae bacterium]